jgi:hypothetical protein
MNSSQNQMTGEKARQEWIDASGFHDLPCVEVLKEVSRRVTDLRSQNHRALKSHPLVLLDLDSTLYEVGPRTHQILREWLSIQESDLLEGVDLKARVESAEAHQIGYSLADTFRSLGVDPQRTMGAEQALRSAKAFWLERFFSSKYLPFDRAYPGAAEFVQELYQLGAELVYLTGRDEPGMGEGTRENLIRDGFPWNTDRTHLLMKPRFEMPDLDHKKGAAEFIREKGKLVASFENEPKNLVALAELFPEAMHVFVQTVYSDHPAMPTQGLYRIRGFI